jgi:poly(3-hydroxybutyrate) depolymerase
MVAEQAGVSGRLDAGGGGQSGGSFGTGGSGQGGGAGGAEHRAGAGGQAGIASGGGGQAGHGTGSGGAGGAAGRSISFGTLLDAQAVMSSAQALAQSLASPNSSAWRAKGDQHRKYHFADANTDEPYRIYVPSNWDGSSSLPMAVFLHGSGSDENSYLDQNNQQMLTLAQEHGYLLVSPLGDQGAYGNFLRLTAPFGDEAGAAELMAAVTPDSERINELSEKDVINVLELVLSEYPVDRTSMFLFGHSMGSGGTWYIGGKYASYWRGLAPMSGPFVEKTGYPWDSVRPLALFVTEGTQTPSVDASRLLRDWLKDNGFQATYEEVNADHGGMIPLVLPDIFDFFDASRSK